MYYILRKVVQSLLEDSLALLWALIHAQSTSCHCLAKFRITAPWNTCNLYFYISVLSLSQLQEKTAATKQAFQYSGFNCPKCFGSRSLAITAVYRYGSHALSSTQQNPIFPTRYATIMMAVFLLPIAPVIRLLSNLFAAGPIGHV